MTGQPQQSTFKLPIVVSEIIPFLLLILTSCQKPVLFWGRSALEFIIYQLHCRLYTRQLWYPFSSPLFVHYPVLPRVPGARVTAQLRHFNDTVHVMLHYFVIKITYVWILCPEIKRANKLVLLDVFLCLMVGCLSYKYSDCIRFYPLTLFG